MSEPIPYPADGDDRSPRARAADDPARGDRPPGAARDRPEERHGDRRPTGSRPDTRPSSRGKSSRAVTDGPRVADDRGVAQSPPGDGPSTPRRGHRAAADDAAPAGGRRGGQWPMAQRSLLAGVLGVPPLAAVGVAAALTAIGVAVDLLRIGTVGSVFLVCYLSGCVLATAWVRRSGLFWPMVAPPLLMALAIPVVVLLAAEPRPGAGVTQRLLVIGAPLVNGFPMMAWTTGLVLLLGVIRLVTQRLRPDRRERAATRVAARTSASPRRS